MKNLLRSLLLFCFFAVGTASVSRAQVTKKDLNLQLSYFNDNNRVQYLKATAKTKIDGRFQFVAGIPLHFYITADSPANLLGAGVTDEKGEAVLFIPPSARSEWLRSPKQSFIAVSESKAGFDVTRAEMDMTKARLRIDTAADRKISVVLMESKDSGWAPVKGVDLRVAVKRLDGNLNVGETPTYTTDSTGTVSPDFKRDTLPGDTVGNLVLVASVEDNDSYGNLTAERVVPWGVARSYVDDFNKRTLFARRGKSPLWLELMAYATIVVVWGVLLYLIGQIRKLRKLGSVSV